MVKPFFLALPLTLALLVGGCLAAPDNDKAAPRASKAEPVLPAVSTALFEATQAWAARADLWRLVARGEALANRIELIPVKSNQLEAWVCGAQKICLSTRLLREFSPEEQQAVFAHELGHLLIPRGYDTHPQLWEAQCDLFAATYLRDAKAVQKMLNLLAADCAHCSDQQHPPPRARAALVEYFVGPLLVQVSRYDEFRQRSFAVNVKLNPRRVPQALQRLSFAVNGPATKALAASPKPKHLLPPPPDLQRLNFAIQLQAAAAAGLAKPTLTP